jgi:hypothetical protein
MGPACGRQGGNDGRNPNGTGCNAEDLCAPGWHLCRDRIEVAQRSPTGCEGAVQAGAELFFATAQSSLGFEECSENSIGDNDLFGCGSLGTRPKPSCAPLDRTSGHGCAALREPWRCGDPNAIDEALLVVKPGPGSGGVLCCCD